MAFFISYCSHGNLFSFKHVRTTMSYITYLFSLPFLSFNMHPTNITSTNFYQLVQQLTCNNRKRHVDEKKSMFAETYVSFPEFGESERTVKKTTISMKPEVIPLEATPCFC